jgi:UDP-N-acetylmuramoyl-L-alanyl-D-glutamate--2,6-diaminopimelate ligase
VRFHTAVFTNLTRDHLDYHRDMPSYGAAKARLFDWPTLAARVINVDDPFGLELARSQLQSRVTQQGPNERLFLTSQRPAEWVASGADYVCASAVDSRAQGLRIQLQTSRGAAQLDSSLIGDFNVDNLLSVLAVLLAWDVPLQLACEALAKCSAPPGRMQAVGGEGRPLALVDYAHTPDALAKALHAARAHCRGRLWCVFGAGGERDPGKRAEMGQIAATLADTIIVTDDNPRREDPRAIVEAVMSGVIAAGAASRARVMHDRRRAIHAALELAATADVVLIAGKGHEQYQIVGNERRAFSDVAVVAEALDERVRA